MYEFSSLFWICEASICIRYVYIIFNTSQTAQFCFYYNAMSVSIKMVGITISLAGMAST